MELKWRRISVLGIKSFTIGFLFAGTILFIESIAKCLILMRIRTTDLSNSLFLLSPFPFASFDPNRREITLSVMQSGSTITLDIVYLIFMFLICSGYLAPTIKYSLSEMNYKTSWLSAFRIAAKSTVLGFIVAIVFLVMPFAYYHSLFFSSRPSSLLYPQSILADFLKALVFLATFYAVAKIPMYMFALKLTSLEVQRATGTSWMRSFLASLKLNSVGLLLSLPFTFCALAISSLILSYTFSVGRFEAYIIGIILADFLVFGFSILMQIPTTVLLVKYLLCELEKT